MQIEFWGVRGSLPTPGPDTAQFGGNTPCVEARLEEGGPLIIFDAGTGIRKLGMDIVANRPDVEEIVIMLGFNTIKNMALSVAVVNAIGIRDDFKWFSNEQFWEHCLGCAIASRNIAKLTRVATLEVEEYFVAGLLHDMGRADLVIRSRH